MSDAHSTDNNNLMGGGVVWCAVYIGDYTYATSSIYSPIILIVKVVCGEIGHPKKIPFLLGIPVEINHQRTR